MRVIKVFDENGRAIVRLVQSKGIPKSKSELIISDAYPTRHHVMFWIKIKVFVSTFNTSIMQYRRIVMIIF